MATNAGKTTRERTASAKAERQKVLNEKFIPLVMNLMQSGVSVKEAAVIAKQKYALTAVQEEEANEIIQAAKQAIESKKRVDKGLLLPPAKIITKGKTKLEEAAEDLQRSKGRIQTKIGREELLEYLNQGVPNTLIMIRKLAAQEASKAKIDGPATERLEIMNKKLEESGYMNALETAEKNLNNLIHDYDPLTRMRALEAAGELQLPRIVEIAAKDNDELIRLQAGKIAVQLGMKGLIKEIMENPNETYKIKIAVDNEIRAADGNTTFKNIYQKVVMGSDPQLREILKQIKKEDEARKERKK